MSARSVQQPGIPGTLKQFTPVPVLDAERTATAKEMGLLEFNVYRQGECLVLVDQEPAGPGGAPLWHLSISHPSRYPTWDEIKVARYKLLPLDVTVGVLLPPPSQYTNVEEQDNVFHLWQVAT